jgi:hydroxyethylthiazole kinase
LNLIWIMPAQGTKADTPYSSPPIPANVREVLMPMDVNTFLEAVRTKKPLVHHLTNWVTIYDCAQVVKSFGASPVMAHAPEEVTDMTGLASSLVLNIGTLTTELVESMLAAVRAANQFAIPVVLDVCGAGSTAFRDQMCFRLINDAHIDVIKGNASEIARIAGLDVRTRGVDTAHISTDLRELAGDLARTKQCTVAITGPDDIIADATQTFVVHNGHEMMSHVVGTGCMAASVIGSFVGASPQAISAAAAAGLCCYGIAGELAAQKSAGPAAFKLNLLDSIFALTPADITARQRVDT